MLAVIWFYLVRRYVVAGPQEHRRRAGIVRAGGRGRAAFRLPTDANRSAAREELNSWDCNSSGFVVVAVLFLGFFILEGWTSASGW